MAKKILDYTIIMPEQMPKVEGVEQQWRVVERAMCSCKAGNPPGRNPHYWESVAELKTVLAEGLSSQDEARKFIHKIKEPADTVFHSKRWGYVLKFPKATWEHSKRQRAILGLQVG